MTAATFAKTLDETLSMNGVPRSTEIGILHEVLEITAVELPSQYVRSVWNAVKSPYYTMMLNPVIKAPYAVFESLEGLVHWIRISFAETVVVGA